MSKKHKSRSGKRAKAKMKAPKGDVVWKQTAEEATLAKMPRYDGFACGHGAHGSSKYDRAKAKRDFARQLRNDQKGASSGSFRFLYVGDLKVAKDFSTSGFALRSK